MFGSGGPVAWLVTAWFAVLCVAALVAVLRARGAVGRGSGAAHLLMCVVMAAMPWSWSMVVPALVWLLVFSALALWFVGLALFGSSGAHGHVVPVPAYHAVMMASMAWMAVLMTTVSAPAGMHQHSDPGPVPSWSGVVSGAFVAVFALASLWYLRRLARPAPSSGADGATSATDLLAGLGMALGMGGSFVLLH